VKYFTLSSYTRAVQTSRAIGAGRLDAAITPVGLAWTPRSHRTPRQYTEAASGTYHFG